MLDDTKDTIQHEDTLHTVTMWLSIDVVIANCPISVSVWYLVEDRA